MPYLGTKFTRAGAVAFGGTPIPFEFNPPGVQNSMAFNELSKAQQQGVASLFNPYAVVAFPSLEGSNNALRDENNEHFFPSAKTSLPTINNLVNNFGEKSKVMPYNYTDFLYCKYVGKIPNNQLITLRRYPAPTFDNLAIPGTLAGKMSDYVDSKTGASIKAVELENKQEHFFPIAQAVTWFGEETGNKLSELLGFSVNINWKTIEAEVNTVSGNEQGSEESPAGGAAKLLGALTGQVNTPFATANSQYDPYNNGPYAHRVYGPVNVIKAVKARDRGLEFKQDLTLNFHYSLKSIGNINPKAAMLDLMSNILALTYNNGAFWGGANRYFPQKPTYPFLGGKDGMNAWYKGQPVAFAKAVQSQISNAASGVMDFLGKLQENPIAALKGLAAGAAKLGMIEAGKGRAPGIIAMKALLTGEPIGEWHMVIGNPFNPIAMIGNLICTEAKFSFNDIIGHDDFPTEMTVAISLEHGRARDSGDVQSMFNRGEGRIYYPPKNALDFLNMSSATRNSTNDTSWKTKGGGFNYTKTVGLFTGTSSEFDAILGQAKIAKNEGTAVTDKGELTAHELADKMFDRTAASGKKGEPDAAKK